VTVGVRLDDGHEAGVWGAAAEGVDVVPDRAEVDLGPRTCQAAANGASCGARLVKPDPRLAAGIQDVEDQDVHAGDDAREAFSLDDG
jgi:hypothetical protein